MQATQRSAAFAEALQKELDATRMRAAETAAKLAEMQAKVQAEVQAKGEVEEALAAMQVGKGRIATRLGMRTTGLVGSNEVFIDAAGVN